MIHSSDLDRATERLWAGLRDPAGRMVLAASGTGVLAALCLVGWVAQPDRFASGYAPDQPIAFSHRLHAGTLAVPCLHCHPGAEKSRAAGVPALETCMGCHQVTKASSPAVRKLAALYEKGEVLAWKRVHSLPGHVFFDHRPHVSAGFACQSCHGPVQEMAVLRQGMSLRMGHCLECHRAPKPDLPAGSSAARGPENCYACHR